MFFIKSAERSRTQTASRGRASVPSEESRPVGRMHTKHCYVGIPGPYFPLLTSELYPAAEFHGLTDPAYGNNICCLTHIDPVFL